MIENTKIKTTTKPEVRPTKLISGSAAWGSSCVVTCCVVIIVILKSNNQRLLQSNTIQTIVETEVIGIEGVQLLEVKFHPDTEFKKAK